MENFFGLALLGTSTLAHIVMVLVIRKSSTPKLVVITAVGSFILVLCTSLSDINTTVVHWVNIMAAAHATGLFLVSALKFMQQGTVDATRLRIQVAPVLLRRIVAVTALIFCAVSTWSVLLYGNGVQLAICAIVCVYYCIIINSFYKKDSNNKLAKEGATT